MGTQLKLNEKIKKALRILRSKGHMRTLGKFTRNMIQLRTRLGFGVSGVRKTKLKKLSPKYVVARVRDKKRGELSSTTSPTRSNVTRTGQMLAGMKYRFRTGRASVYIDGPRENSALTNEQVQEFVRKQGRSFMSLSRPERKQIINRVKKKVRAVFARLT